MKNRIVLSLLAMVTTLMSFTSAMAGHEIEGFWTSPDARVNLEVRETSYGIKAKRMDKSRWYYYDRKHDNTYLDRVGNRYFLDRNGNLVFRSNTGRREIKFRRDYNNRNDHHSRNNYDQYERYDDYERGDYNSRDNRRYDRYDRYDNYDRYGNRRNNSV